MRRAYGGRRVADLPGGTPVASCAVGVPESPLVGAAGRRPIRPPGHLAATASNSRAETLSELPPGAVQPHREHAVGGRQHAHPAGAVQPAVHRAEDHLRRVGAGHRLRRVDLHVRRAQGRRREPRPTSSGRARARHRQLLAAVRAEEADRSGRRGARPSPRGTWAVNPSSSVCARSATAVRRHRHGGQRRLAGRRPRVAAQPPARPASTTAAPAATRPAAERPDVAAASARAAGSRSRTSSGDAAVTARPAGLRSRRGRPGAAVRRRPARLGRRPLGQRTGGGGERRRRHGRGGDPAAAGGGAAPPRAAASPAGRPGAVPPGRRAPDPRGPPPRRRRDPVGRRHRRGVRRARVQRVVGVADQRPQPPAHLAERHPLRRLLDHERGDDLGDRAARGRAGHLAVDHLGDRRDGVAAHVVGRAPLDRGEQRRPEPPQVGGGRHGLARGDLRRDVGGRAEHQARRWSSGRRRRCGRCRSR